MLRLRRQHIIEKLQTIPVHNLGGYRNLVNDATEGPGDQAMAFLIKKGKIKFPITQLKEEVNNMVEKNMLTIGQWEQMLSLLDNAGNGQERVTNFLRRKRRIAIL